MNYTETAVNSGDNLVQWMYKITVCQLSYYTTHTHRIFTVRLSRQILNSIHLIFCFLRFLLRLKSISADNKAFFLIINILLSAHKFHSPVQNISRHIFFTAFRLKMLLYAFNAASFVRLSSHMLTKKSASTSI